MHSGGFDGFDKFFVRSVGCFGEEHFRDFDMVFLDCVMLKHFVSYFESKKRTNNES